MGVKYGVGCYPKFYRQSMKQKLQIFLNEVSVLNDFIDILTPEEFYIIYTKHSIICQTWEKICNYEISKGWKEKIEAQIGEITEAGLQKIYTKGINKIIPLVSFEFNDYCYEIKYEGRGRMRPQIKTKRARCESYINFRVLDDMCSTCGGFLTLEGPQCSCI